MAKQMNAVKIIVVLLLSKQHKEIKHLCMTSYNFSGITCMKRVRHELPLEATRKTEKLQGSTNIINICYLIRGTYTYIEQQKKNANDNDKENQFATHMCVVLVWNCCGDNVRFICVWVTTLFRTLLIVYRNWIITALSAVVAICASLFVYVGLNFNFSLCKEENFILQWCTWNVHKNKMGIK